MQALQINEIESNFENVLNAVLRLSTYQGVTQFEDVPLFRKMLAKMDRQEKLVFLLPAFPAKSPSPLKTAGVLPDMGEVIGLMNLQKMCAEISANYSAGADVLICSDGRVFSDVVDVSDAVIDQYAEGIDEIIREFNLFHLKTFSMDNVHPELAPNDLRGRLLDQFAVSLEDVREKVRNSAEGINLFNGMHRFMIEDQRGRTALSKTQIHKQMKERTYELMRRSDAWSNLLVAVFPEALRLSIHPHALTSEKFGVKLLTAAQNWATPWHNVTVRTEGRFELMPLDEAMEKGAEKRIFGGKYVYFEI